MRGRSSSAKSRLRSAGYKCNLCGRRLIDAQTLKRHQKTIHNISPRSNKVSFKAKPTVQKGKLTNKEKDKIFDALLKDETQVESKPKARNSKNNYENLPATVMVNVADGGKILSNTDSRPDENGKRLLAAKKMKDKKKESKNSPRRVEFQCPVCEKTFNIYFTAHKHIQKAHSVNADGKKVAPNSLDLVQPIRVEQCFKCDSTMKSNEKHICSVPPEEAVSIVTEYICSGCNQNFVSLKTFDMHVAGLHSDAVDSMFFPTKLEFMNWRLEMERQTNAKYSLYGEYESKKIYRCNYAREEVMKYISTAYFCPSSMVVQDFSKGIQVHFYNKHYDHDANDYTLSSKYKKYSITSFLKHPDEGSVRSGDSSLKLEEKDLRYQFKKLMDSIVLNAADVDVVMLHTLIERALEMSAILTDVKINQTLSTSTPAKNISDTEIAEVLEMKTILSKRRRSADICEISPKPAKRTRNKSLYNQSDIKMEPKIVNTFSLASNANSEELKSIKGNLDLHSAVSDGIDKINTTLPEFSNIEANNIKSETEEKTNKPPKINTRLTSFNESLSFNDSYKDFIDKNFIGKTDKCKDIKTRSTVKTRLGEYKQLSPKKVENKNESSSDLSTNNRNIVGIKPITPANTKIEEAMTAPKANTVNIEGPNVNILNIECPDVTITKVNTVRMDSPKVANPQMKSRPDTPRINTRGAFSHLVDPLQVNITKVNRCVPSPVKEPMQVNTKCVSSPAADPLELNVTKVRNRNVSSAIVEPLPRTTKRVVSSVDPLKINTPKVDPHRSNTLIVEPLKLNTHKTNTVKVHGNKVTSKLNSNLTKVSPKVTPKVTANKKSTSTNNTRRVITPLRKIPELKYEVREQDNDCNILVLKL